MLQKLAVVTGANGGGGWREKDGKCAVGSKLWRKKAGVYSLKRKRNQPQVPLIHVTPPPTYSHTALKITPLPQREPGQGPH